jgi:hypothetical protein
MPEFDITNDATGETITVSGSQAPTPEDAAAIFASRAKAAPLIAPRAPSSIQPPVEGVGAMQQTGNVAMEAVAGFNRPFAWLADRSILAPINLVQQMRGKPMLSLESMVGEKGQFAGEGMITDAAAAAGELSSAFLGGGTVTRTFASLLDDAARYGENAVRGVIRQMGRVTPSQDIAMGGAAGIGGEVTAAVAERVLGEEYEDAGRTVGQFAFPVAASVTLQAVANIGKEMLSRAAWRVAGGDSKLIASAPTPQDLRGASRAIYTKVSEEAGLISPDGGAGLSTAVDKIVSDNFITRDIYPATARVANNIKRRVESGKITFAYLDKMHSLLGVINSENAAEARVATILNEVVDQAIFSLRPTNPGALTGLPGNGTIESIVQTGRTLYQRSLSVGKLDRIFEATRMEVLGNGKDFQKVLRSKLTSLMADKKSMSGMLPEHRKAVAGLFEGGSVRKLLELGGKLGANSQDFYKTMMYYAPAAIGGALSSGNPLIIGTTVGVPVVMTASKIMSARANAIFKQDGSLMKAILASGTDGKRVLQAYFSRTPPGKRNVQDMTALLITSGADLAALNSVPLAKSVLVGDAIYLAGIGQGIIAREAEAEQRQAP